MNANVLQLLSDDSTMPSTEYVYMQQASNVKTRSLASNHPTSQHEDSANVEMADTKTAMANKQMGVYYGVISFFISILHNVFLLYHVETFVSIYKIDKFSFWIGEVIFLVWNSCNDPLFGWISDKQYLFQTTENHHVVLKRLTALTWNGPFLALAFSAIWISWTYPAIQFVICLCVYDGFLTMVDLHHSALLADLAVSQDARTRLNFYCSLFSAFGSLSVFLSYLLWNKDNLITFQMFCMGLAAVSVLGFILGARKLRQVYTKTCMGQGQDLASVT